MKGYWNVWNIETVFVIYQYKQFFKHLSALFHESFLIILDKNIPLKSMIALDEGRKVDI